MTEVMMIAPGTSMDRAWVSGAHGAVTYATGPYPAPTETAVIVRYLVPGWRFPLRFAVAPGVMVLGMVPDGYVLPGRVQGERAESARACTRCGGHEVPPVPPWDEESAMTPQAVCDQIRTDSGLAVARR